MDSNLCDVEPGKIKVKVNSLDPNLTFFYNGVLVTALSLGSGVYELSISAPTANGIVRVKNGQDCWVTEIISNTIIAPDFTFTSSNYENYGFFAVNGSVQFTNLIDLNTITPEYDHIVWDFGDSTPFKVFYYPDGLLPTSPGGESFQTVFHTYTADGIYQITLTVYNQFGCSKQITKTIIIGSGANMMLPTIFTPNNDGINDLFRPSLVGLKDVAMYIYDGWGNLVYEFSSEVSVLTSDWGWDGVEKGKNEPMNNNYRYYIMATTINDVKIEKEGRFLLVK
jgi:gliding motility-associated-like protein